MFSSKRKVNLSIDDNSNLNVIKGKSDIISGNVQFSKTAKVVFTGATNVGKSSIVHRSYHQSKLFIPTPTIGAAFNRKQTIRDNKLVSLEIWDTAGQERFRSLCPMYFRNCSYCVLVFDVSDHNSFLDVKTWKDICDKTNTQRSPVYFLVGNKIDLDKRAVKLSEIQTYCIENNIFSYVETSAYTGEGVEHLFDKLYDHVYNYDTILPESVLTIDNKPTCSC